MDIEQVKEKLREHKQSGNELIFQICPSCQDTKNHFYLNPETCQFHCFKCNIGGGFYGLVKLLGLDMPETNSKAQEAKEIASQWFRELLSDDPTAETARTWLGERGIEREYLSGLVKDGQITKFLPIGCYPGTSRVLKHFKELGYSVDEIQEAGLLPNKVNDKPYLVFTCHTTPTRIGRFKLRTIGGSSKDTFWLGEGACGVFGLPLYDYRGKGEAIGLEGEFDCLSLQLWAWKQGKATTNAVCLSGGAAGSGSEMLSKLGIQKLRLIPDNDEAGLKFVSNCIKNDMSIVIHTIPKQFNDIDEYIQKAETVDLKAVYESQSTPGGFFASGLIKYGELKLDTPEGLQDARQKAVKNAVGWNISGIDLDDFINGIAEPLQVKPDSIKGLINSQKPINFYAQDNMENDIDEDEQVSLELVRASDMLARDMPKPPMIFERILPREGYSVIASFTKEGKTTLGSQIILSALSGTDFLIFPFENPVSSILYLYWEMDLSDINDLIKTQLAGWQGKKPDMNKLFMVDCHEISLDTAEGIKLIGEKIDESGAELVIIDPLMMAVSGDISDMKTVKNVNKTLKQISKGKVISWLMIHHYSKPGANKRESIHAAYGSSGWANFCVSFMGLERYSEKRSPDYKKLSFKVRRGRLPADMCVRLNPENRLFDIIENPEDEIEAIPAERVREVFQEESSKSGLKEVGYSSLVTWVEFSLGTSEITAKRLVKQALDERYIYKKPGKFGKYHLNDTK